MQRFRQRYYLIPLTLNIYTQASRSGSVDIGAALHVTKAAWRSWPRSSDNRATPGARSASRSTTPHETQHAPIPSQCTDLPGRLWHRVGTRLFADPLSFRASPIPPYRAALGGRAPSAIRPAKPIYQRPVPARTMLSSIECPRAEFPSRGLALWAAMPIRTGHERMPLRGTAIHRSPFNMSNRGLGKKTDGDHRRSTSVRRTSQPSPRVPLRPPTRNQTRGVPRQTQAHRNDPRADARGSAG